MTTERPRPPIPAYRRLSDRQARRALVPVAAVCVVIAAASLGAHTLQGVDPFGVTWMASLTVAFVVMWALAARGPRQALPFVTGGLGVISVAAVCMDLVVPLLSPSLTAGLLGLIPIGVVVFGMWELRAHIVWLATSTLLVLLFLVVGREEPRVQAAIPSTVAGWAVGGVFSLLAQQGLDRSRFAIYRSARRAHAARTRASKALRQLQAVEAIGRALSQRGATDDTLLARCACSSTRSTTRTQRSTSAMSSMSGSVPNSAIRAWSR